MAGGPGLSADRCSPAPRMPADEDGAAAAQHLHHPLPAVDHGHRAHVPCRDPRGAVRAGDESRCPKPRDLGGGSPRPGRGWGLSRLTALQGGVDNRHPDGGRRAQEAGGGDDGLPVGFAWRELRGRGDGGGAGQAQAPRGEARPCPWGPAPPSSSHRSEGGTPGSGRPGCRCSHRPPEPQGSKSGRTAPWSPTSPGPLGPHLCSAPRLAAGAPASGTPHHCWASSSHHAAP